MRFHLLTVEVAQRFGQSGKWRIMPSVLLRGLAERGPNLMMPMAGEEVELRLPDGRVMSAHIASFGVEAWQGSDGSLYTTSDPADPSLTLTITCSSDIAEVPAGTEIWLPNARSASVSDAS